MANYKVIYSWRIRGDISGAAASGHILPDKMTDVDARTWAVANGVDIERLRTLQRYGNSRKMPLTKKMRVATE